MMDKSKVILYAVATLFVTTDVMALDSTHTHPLVTSRIADVIEQSPDAASYEELFVKNDTQDETNPAKQRLYWGTDFDPIGLGKPGLTLEQKIDYLLKDQFPQYNQYNQYNQYDTVIDGVVQEDLPLTKVFNHFYHATTGKAMSENSETSAVRSMRFFIEGIRRMGGYTEEAKHSAFFEFGQSLHHVEDMIDPAHIHNDVENALFVPMRRYGQLKNTHVENSTLRFLNSPCLALKQTERFQNINGEIES